MTEINGFFAGYSCPSVSDQCIINLHDGLIYKIDLDSNVTLLSFRIDNETTRNRIISQFMNGEPTPSFVSDSPLSGTIVNFDGKFGQWEAN